MAGTPIYRTDFAPVAQIRSASFEDADMPREPGRPRPSVHDQRLASHHHFNSDDPVPRRVLIFPASLFGCRGAGRFRRPRRSHYQQNNKKPESPKPHRRPPIFHKPPPRQIPTMGVLPNGNTIEQLLVNKRITHAEFTPRAALPDNNTYSPRRSGRGRRAGFGRSELRRRSRRRLPDGRG